MAQVPSLQGTDKYEVLSQLQEDSLIKVTCEECSRDLWSYEKIYNGFFMTEDEQKREQEKREQVQRYCGELNDSIRRNEASGKKNIIENWMYRKDRVARVLTGYDHAQLTVVDLEKVDKEIEKVDALCEKLLQEWREKNKK